MNREELSEDLPVLLALHRDSGHLEYKEGTSNDPGDLYDRIIAVKWVEKTDEGGPWRRVSITPEGFVVIDRVFQATGVLD
jgi:hypothetical protein